jgi:hypothetical protein
MGAEISIFVPEHPDIAGSEAQAYVDNGWGFLLLKMGLLGLLIFLMLLWRFLGFAARNWPFGFPDKRQRVQGCLLAILLYALLGFIGGPTFFQFLHSGFVATDLGALAVLAGFTNQRSERLNFRLRRS